jgi:hypothetical protein
MSRAWSQGSSTRWRKLRAAVLRANASHNRGRCTIACDVMCPRHERPCVGVCTGVATVVHHTKGKAYGDRIEDLAAACAACNAHVGDPGAYNAAPRPVSRW